MWIIPKSKLENIMANSALISLVAFIMAFLNNNSSKIAGTIAKQVKNKIFVSKLEESDI